MRAAVNGVELHYELEGEGPPVVLLPGLTALNDVWEGVRPGVAKEFTVLTFDQRGTGRSTGKDAPHSVPTLAADVLGLLDHLGWDRAALVGISMGGGIAQTFAFEYPDRISALVLVSTSSEFLPETVKMFHARADHAEREGMAGLVDTMMGQWYSEDLLEEEREKAEAMRQALLSLDPRVFAARARANAERGWTERLGEIRCPVLFVGGELDVMDAPVHLERYRRHVADFEGHVMPGVAHALTAEAPDEYNAIMLPFLRRVL